MQGSVTAKAPGTASVTAFVTKNGKTLSDSYPLKDMPDLKPSAITVSGKRIPGFNPDIHSYSFLLSSQSAKVPVVTSASPYPEVTVETVQADAIPERQLFALMIR
jgi:hypothetical protein